jgi:peptide/nickel transport system substrate-binding protein
MRKRAFAVGAAIVALGLAACGAPKAPNAQNTSPAWAGPTVENNQETFQSVLDPDAKGPAKEVEGAQKGGTITVLTASIPDRFDPTSAYYIDTLAVHRLITRGLTEMVLGDDGKYHLMPDLATNLGDHNADYTEWTFKLKDGLKWEDGSPVTADDVIYGIKRSFAVVEYPDGPTYQQTYFKDGDTYKGPEKGGDFTGIEKVDDSTVKMHLVKPFADLQYYLTFPAMAPFKQAKDTKSNYGLHPFSNGPYKWKAYSAGKSLSLVKNDQWDPATDPGRHQYADGFEFKYGLDPLLVQKRMVANKGEDQSALTYDGVDASVIPDILGKEPEQRFLAGGGTCTFYRYLDTRKIPLEVRKAIYQAEPFDDTYKAGGLNKYTDEPATTILPKVTPGWENFDVSGTGGKGHGNPDKAKSILEAAGKMNFELKTALSTGEGTEIAAKVSQVRQQAYTKAGFKYTVMPVPSAKSRAVQGDPNADINIRSGGWCLDWPSGGTVFPAIFDGRLIAQNPTSAPNKSFLNEDDVNAEIDRISALPSDQAAPEWAKLDKMMMEKYLPVIPTTYSRTSYLHGSKIGGTTLDVFSGGPDFTHLFVKP